MSEHDAGAPGPAPAAGDDGDVKVAAAWLITHRDRYTEVALNHELRVAGYSEDQIGAIRAEADRLAPPPRPPEPYGKDYRATAAVVMIVAFLGVWAVLTIPWLAQEGGLQGWGQVVGVILGVALLVIAVPTLVVISGNDRLKRGTAGALVAVLSVPFVLLFIVAGLCVMTVGRPEG